MTTQGAIAVAIGVYAAFVTALLFAAVVKVGRLEEDIDALHRTMDREEFP